MLDFGLASLVPQKRTAADVDSALPTAAAPKEHLTSPGATVGTVAYMSPGAGEETTRSWRGASAARPRRGPSPPSRARRRWRNQRLRGRTARPSGAAGRILSGASTDSTPSCVLAAGARCGWWDSSVKRILAELGLSPPEEEKPPPIREVFRVPMDDDGREIQAS